METGRDGQGAVDRDEFRHVREVLARRTPDSILTVNRYGMGINARATGKAVTVLMRKSDDPNHAQVDNDLDALSILWNTANELLAAIDSKDTALAAGQRIIERLAADLDRERRRAAEMRRALEWYALGKQDGGLWAASALKDADAPGPGGEGENDGH